MSRLDGRIAIVTGGGRGIGRATVLKLASEGARIVVNDLDEQPTHEVVDAVRKFGGTAVACPGDITTAALGDELVEQAIREFGGLDLLVNNAGYVWNSTLIKSTDEQLDAMLDVHVRGPVRILRAAGRWFRKAARQEASGSHQRKVVNVSSLSGLHGAATQASYSTAKSAVFGLTKTLAKEWGRYRVNVNCVAFGHIETRLTQPYDGDPPTIEVGDKRVTAGIGDQQRNVLEMATPLGRSGTVEEAAGAVFLLCLPESDFITGEIVVASGGLVM